MRTECPSCGTLYRRGLDANDDPWRTLCPCERKLKCSQCRAGAVYAVTREKRVIYLCGEHAGVKPEKKEEVSLGEVKRRVPRAVAPVKAHDPLPDTRDPATIKWLYEGHTYRVKCACGDTHRFCDREPRVRFEIPESVPRMCCPKCKGGYPETRWQEVKEGAKK